MTVKEEAADARARAYQELLTALRAGGDAAAVARAKPVLADASPRDLVDAVDAALAAGMEALELKPAVSRLVNLMATPLSRHRLSPPPGERLFSSLCAENAGLLRALERGKALAKAINRAEDESLARRERLRAELEGLAELCAELGQVERHYVKKENVLFPWFEARYPRYRCVRLMWDIHDDARRDLKEVARLCATALAELSTDRKNAAAPGQAPGSDFDPGPLNQALGRLYFDLNAAAFREDCALYPLMLGLMPPDEGERLFAEAAAFGYAFLDEAALARLEGPEAVEAAAARVRLAQADGWVASGHGLGGQGSHGAHPMSADRLASLGFVPQPGYSSRTGSLAPETLSALFAALPVDMTFVDADDRVRWFSDSPHRVFPRSPAVLGRDVRNCHPGASVGRVVALLEAFKRGDKDREAFWITMRGRFIHIEYFALRAPDGGYLGTLESTQDLTELRALEGEKRLADRDASSVEA